MDADTNVLHALIARFKSDPVLFYKQLTVVVRNGVATVCTGRVVTLAERDAIERAGENIAGMKMLILEVRRGQVPEVSSLES